MTAATNSPLAGPFNLKEVTDAISQRVIGKPVLQVDEALNDSDKSFTVPANTNWEILSVWVELISTATVGNRAMMIEVQDSAADIIAQLVTGLTVLQIASLTRNYYFYPGAPDLTAFIDTDKLTTPIPKLVLPESSIIRVFDKAAVDAAADDMVVQMLVLERVEI